MERFGERAFGAKIQGLSLPSEDGEVRIPPPRCGNAAVDHSVAAGHLETDEEDFFSLTLHGGAEFKGHL
jgi:hypothetical protein